MEITLRFGADKRKAKIIEEQQSKIYKLEEEIRGLKIDNGVLVIKNERLNRSLKYYKKKVGNKYEINSKPRLQRNDKNRNRAVITKKEM